MAEVRLGDSDRERFGCEEWLPLSLVDVSIADMTELCERFSFDAFDWPHPFLGEVKFEDAGNPDAPRKAPYWQIQAIVWLTLHQSGHMVTWDEAGTVKAAYVLLRSEAEPGKDEGDTSPSQTPEPSTTPPSDTSTE